MNKTKYMPLISILLISLSFRFFINYFISINQQINLWVILAGMINLLLVFNITQKVANYKIGMLTALLYAISPWTAYLELAGSQYIILLSCLLIIYSASQMFNLTKKFSLPMVALVIIIFLIKFNQITIFSDVGLVNAVNTFRGETNKTMFAPIGKIVENRYIYLSEHFVFNILKQFTPATYFTNQVQLLGFSFSPPIYVGFLIPFLFGFIKMIKLLPKSKAEVVTALSLIVPSILSKESPDLSHSILVSPIIFFCISIGLNDFLENYKKQIFRLLLLITLFMVVLQFLTTLSDIVIREPIRLQSIKKNV